MKGTPIANGLTKIEENEEIENDEPCSEPDQTNSAVEAHSKYQDKSGKDNELTRKDENSSDFDPLKYAIEFFSSYNPDTNQFNIKPSISSQG